MLLPVGPGREEERTILFAAVAADSHDQIPMYLRLLLSGDQIRLAGHGELSLQPAFGEVGANERGDGLALRVVERTLARRG